MADDFMVRSETVKGGADASSVRMPTAIRARLRQEPALRARVNATKAFRQAVEHPINIDITSRCNLKCEGCFFYEGDHWLTVKEETDETVWARFFTEQKAQGRKFAFIHGAEPALVQDRLVMASQMIPRGSINTNGTIRMRPDITLPLHVAVWGENDFEKIFRGGSIFTKVMRNFGGDRRARFLFTVNRFNIDQIDAVARAVRDEGGKLFFNYFAPTEQYLAKLRTRALNDDQYFRVSTPEQNLVWDEASLAAARAAIEDAIDAYPDTVWHSKAFNRVMTRPGSWFTLDQDGLASNCLSRNMAEHAVFATDARKSNGKCSTPNIDCSTCKIYPSSLFSIMRQPGHFLADSSATLEDWLDIVRHTSRLFTLESNSAFID